MIVSLLTGCDNVQWGGSDLRLEAPPPTTFGTAAVPDSVEEAAGSMSLPEGPVLYMATRDSVATTLVPVAVITGDSLSPLPTEEQMPGFRAAFARQHMIPGASWVLFAEGVRVGSLMATENLTDDSFCEPRPAVRGPVELVPDAMEARHFLALAESEAGATGYDGVATQEFDRMRHIASINLAGEIIPQVGALWPTSLEAARQDVQAFRLGVEGPQAFAVTYVFRDQMGIAAAQPSSYALFIMGLQRDGEYEPGYVWYREAGREGRGVPRYFGHFDWNGDGESEILLEVLGEQSRWTAAVGLVNGDWRRVWQDPCGAAAPPLTDEEEG